MIDQRILQNYRFIIRILIFSFICFVLTQKSFAQDDVIRVDTDLVTIPATVMDRNGKYITNLKKENFQIFENGVEQEIKFFEPVEQSFTILFLLDRSGSMSNHLKELARAANSFVSQLRPDDKIIAATFADNVDVLLQSTNVKDIQNSIKLNNRIGDRNTMIYDAVDFALKKMKKVRGRKAIVLFSDGSSSVTSVSAKDNMRNAEESEALIYTVQFDTFFKVIPPYLNKKAYYESVETANKYMQDLARISGGRAHQIEAIADLEKTFGAIADELGRQYSLSYYPKQLEAGQKRQVRQIKVKVNVPNVAVRARNSYVVGSKK